LLAQSRTARAAGNYAQANATIERALRIAPNDPSLWVELGEVELATGNAAQAATLARKALTLASANDSVAIADAQQLLRAAGSR
jgi:Flp pilus assembly protein TadD